MTPEQLADIFRSMSGDEKAAFIKAAGLGNSAHAGSRRSKNPIADGTRALVYAREGYRCFWCWCDLRETGAHFDHVRRIRGEDPVYLLGVAACPTCNVTRPADEEEAARVAADIAAMDMEPARVLAASEEGRAMFAAVKRASMGIRPAGPAVPF